MGATFSRFFVEAAGNTIFAANYNGEFDNILDNLTPAGIDDASANVTAMRATADPGESGTESLPTSLEGELQRIRHVLAEITGNTYWYESPTGPSPGSSSGTTVDNTIVRWDGTSGNAIQQSNITIDDFDNLTVSQRTITTSSANTTFTASGVTDASAWDLSEADDGMVAVASGGSKGIIDTGGVNDAGDAITIVSWIPSQPSNGETVAIKSGGSTSLFNFGEVPVGTILDFWDAGGTLSIPDNYAACDGSTVEDAESPLNGVTLPNLNTANGVYTIGTNATGHGTSLDGDTDHSVSIPDHTHTMSHTHTAGSFAARWVYDNTLGGTVTNGMAYDIATMDSWTSDRALNEGMAQYSGADPEVGESYTSGIQVAGTSSAASTSNTGADGAETINIKGASLPVTKIIRIK